MRISKDKLDALCRQRKQSVSSLLKNTGVSRNAFYSLIRKRSIIPRSLHAVAEGLGVPVLALLEETSSPAARMQRLNEEARVIAIRHPDADIDNIRHTLILLDEAPIERLRRALRRGRPVNIR